MHVKTLAPLPPSHYSAGKTKGGGLIQQPKPYLTLSVEKTQVAPTLHKSNSKRKLAVLGNNMMTSNSPNQDLGNITPPNQLLEKGPSMPSYSMGNPTAKGGQAPLI